MSGKIKFEATSGGFNARCESQFIAVKRENFPKFDLPILTKVKPCLVPVKPSTGTSP